MENTSTTAGFTAEQLREYNDFLAYKKKQEELAKEQEKERLANEAKQAELAKIEALREAIRAEERAKLQQPPAQASGSSTPNGAAAAAAVGAGAIDMEKLRAEVLEALRAEVLGKQIGGKMTDQDEDEDVEDKIPPTPKKKAAPKKKETAAAAAAEVPADEPVPMSDDDDTTPATGTSAQGEAVGPKLFESGTAASDALNEYAQARNAMQETEAKYKKLASGMPAHLRVSFEKQLAEQREKVKSYQQQLMKATLDTELAYANKIGGKVKESKKKQYINMMARDVLDDKDLFYIEANMENVCESSALHDRTLEKAELEQQKLREEYARKQLADQMAMEELKSNNANVNEAFGAFQTIFGEDKKSGAFHHQSSGFMPPPGRAQAGGSGGPSSMETDSTGKSSRFEDPDRPGPSEFSAKYGYYAKPVDPYQPKRPDVIRMPRPATIDQVPTYKGRRLQHVRPLDSLQKRGLDESMMRALNIARQEGLNGAGMRFGDGTGFFINKNVAKNFELLDGAIDRGGLQMLPDEVTRGLPENFKTKLTFV